MDAPSPPDPYATAAAQGQSNRETALYQQRLNMVNQNTPYGHLRYSSVMGADGTPQFTADTTLSPELQHLGDTTLQNAQGQSDLANQLLRNARNKLAQPLDLSYGANEARLNELNRHTLDPMWQDRTNQFEQQQYNRGVRPGSAAYDAANRDFTGSRDTAYNNMYLQGHDTATRDAQAEYYSPLNALSALRSGSQVSQPGIGQIQTPQTGVQGTNIAGLIEQNYAQQQAQSAATMGGLFGLGGSAIGAAGMFF
jgi:hypothetical protein